MSTMDMKPDGEATVSPPTIPQAPEVTGKLEYVMMTNSDTPGSGFGMVIPTISSTPPASTPQVAQNKSQDCST